MHACMHTIKVFTVRVHEVTLLVSDSAITDLFTGGASVVGGEPARGQLGDGGNVDDAVVEMREQPRHAPPQELHVHVHRVAGQPRLAGLRVPPHKLQQLHANV